MKKTIVAPRALPYTASLNEAPWRSGHAPDCKSDYPGSIPGGASNFEHQFPPLPTLLNINYDTCLFVIDCTTNVVYRRHMKKMKKPSAAESAILNVLWSEQPCSVKEIHNILSATKDVGYTTTLKQVQRLHNKGMVTRKPGEGKSFLYSAAVKEDATKSDLFNQFVQSAFSNSVSDLVLHALGNEKTSDAEIEKIKAFIAKLDDTKT